MKLLSIRANPELGTGADVFFALSRDEHVLSISELTERAPYGWRVYGF